MGGLQGLTQLGTPDIEQAADQVRQQRLAQASQSNPAINPPQAPQQPQQTQQQGSQQPDTNETAKQYWLQQSLPKASPSGGPVRQALQSFFHGVEQNLMARVGAPTEIQNQQRAIGNYSVIANADAMQNLHQAMASQYQPVPLVGLDGKPITDPTTGHVISLPQNHAATFYAGQQAAASRIQVQQGRSDTATEVQGMRNDAANPLLTKEQAMALGHPELEGQEFGKGISGLLGQQDRLNSAEMIARGHDLTRTEVAKMTLQARANQAKDPNALTNTMKTMKQQAQSTLPGIDRALDETQKMADRLGPAAGRWNDFWQGKVGANDPQFAHYKDEIGMVSSAVTLAHARGRMSNELFEHFQQMFDAGKQSAGNMTQALNVAKEWLGEYATMGDVPSPKTARPTDGFAAWKARQ